MELHTVSEWLKVKKLMLNAMRTKRMIFGTCPKLTDFGNYPLSIDGQPWETGHSFKYFGMTLDEVVSFSENLDNLHKKVSSRLSLL